MAPLEAHDPGLHDLVTPDAPIDRIAGGLTFTEGPVTRTAAAAGRTGPGAPGFTPSTLISL